MEESNLIFKNYKPRCSSLGNIMTNLPQPITEVELAELKDLLNECETGVNSNGNKTKWTDTKASRVKSLQKKQKGEDELPSGAKTHLDDVFRSIFWKRRRSLSNRYLDKGLLTEEDVLALASSMDDDFYTKNKEHYENEYIQGSWDNFKEKIRDTKSNYDLKTFDEADSSSLYEWQLRGYSFIAKDVFKLSDCPQAELIYGLTNNPLHHITNEITRQYYANGTPNEDNEEWLEIKRQIERNMIFDKKLFIRDYPHYIFENKIWQYDIPAKFRVKKFDVSVIEDNILDIKRRVLMSRKYLMDKEIAIYERMKE